MQRYGLHVHTVLLCLTVLCDNRVNVLVFEGNFYFKSIRNTLFKSVKHSRTMWTYSPYLCTGAPRHRPQLRGGPSKRDVGSGVNQGVFDDTLRHRGGQKDVAQV